MIAMNLLPWRSIRRMRRLRRFYLNFLWIFFGILIFILMLRLVLAYAIWQELKQSRYLLAAQDQIAGQLLEVRHREQIENGLLLKLRSLQGIDAKRALPVQILNALPVIVPEHVTLTRVQYQDGKMFFTATGQKSRDITSFMQKMDSPLLQELSAQNSNQANKFSVRVGVRTEGDSR